MKLLKKYSFVILFVLLLLLLLLLWLCFLRKKENFSNNDSVVSVLSNSAGFFSMFFFTLNHYLYCKKNNINFKIESENWTYKKELGWTDYFKDVELSYNDNSNINNAGYANTLGEFNLREYKNAISEIYIYNDKTSYEIQKTKERLGLINKHYDSIFIRRGDKLANEIKFSNASNYIQLLLIKNPNCNTIFLQTDDYNSFIELQEYIEKNNLQIKALTLCDKNMNGASHSNINQMSLNEKYEHTIEIITGVDILANSNICICDYDSNVSRFVKLFYKNPENVYDINYPDIDIDYNSTVCPSYEFSRNIITPLHK